MTTDPRIPEDPIGFIKDSVRARAILWTYHVNMRLKGRFIARERILEAVETYEVIEAYPRDKYLPSYLILARAGKDSYHILFATDVREGNVRIVTAYRPSPTEWLPDLKTRRKSE